MPRPIVVIHASEAVETRKANPFAAWGDRGAANRVEPITKPDFDVPFRMLPGQRVFTVGSCFARNVERELQQRGFEIPVRDLFKRPEFQNVDVSVVNNYGTPSIYNEIAWAFGDQPFDPQAHILETSPGKFTDIHLSPGRRPEARDIVLARRAGITEAYRTAATCDVGIMTLGLAETWFDTKSGCYLNVAPRPSMINAQPDRFQLHVLSYEDVIYYLAEALNILHREAPRMRIVLTISPVPLAATHRPMDVIVANTYSKAVLRTAAEAVVAALEFVSYFPSYESFTLSDRKIAWADDMVHTNDELVTLNVGRMVNAFVTGAKTEVSQITDQAAALVESDPSSALELLSAESSIPATIVRARALTRLGRTREAFELLDPHCTPRRKSRTLWNGLIEAAIASGDIALIENAARRIRGALPISPPPAYRTVESWLRARGNNDLADQFRMPVSR